MEELELPGGRDWADFLEDLYYVDLDHNGLSDVAVRPASYGNGLGAFYKTTLIYLQTSPGEFRRLEFTSLYFDISDFVDLDGMVSGSS